MANSRGIKAKIFCCLITIMFSVLSVQIAIADDSSTLHRFKAGDLLSADIMNEILNKIDNVTFGFKDSSELVGTWQCQTVSTHQWCIDSALYTVHESGLYAYLNQDINFFENPDGTYSYSTSMVHMFTCYFDGWDKPATEGYAVVEGSLIMRDTVKSVTNILTLRKISDTKFIMDPVNTMPRTFMIICEQKDLPPNIPTDLDFNKSGSMITLSWTDNSDNESGFKIMRKDYLDDEYKEIGNTGRNATTYEDSVSATGDFWYRVKATNEHGDSLGSNVVKVTINSVEGGR